MRRTSLWTVAVAAAVCLFPVLAIRSVPAAEARPRPNILWITTEDIGQELGCYGDKFATTPNLDRLAARGMRYKYAWSNAPVCAPARSTIITGVYPPSLGSQHMRSNTHLPPEMKMYPCYLREAGYYCTNNSKQDYNLRLTGQVWDESSRKAHWKNRKEGQPFFAIFNFTVTHESQIRKRPHQCVHDPAKVPVPAYHPDTPEVRLDWTQYYDNITVMDGMAGRLLDELEEAGVADDTIVFFYGDHGSGMPRSKRWPYNSGLEVAMIVYVPEKFKDLAPEEYLPGGMSDRMVSFVDLAPTLLSLVGVKPPDYMQGHAFMGKYAAPPQPYLYGFRGRMDERYDMVRSVRDQRYIYMRQYMPHRIYGQHVNYMFITPTTQVWRRLFDEGKLTPEQSRFWQTKPAEELYDLKADPDEVHNLADSPEHQEVLKRMRKAQQDWALRIRDLGFLPEGEIHTRAGDDAPYTMGHDPKRYPLEKIMAVAELASRGGAEAVPALKKALKAKDSAIRYWAAQGALMRGTDGVTALHDELIAALEDASGAVRVVAAEALGRYGSKADLQKALPVLKAAAASDEGEGYVALMAVNSIDYLGPKAASLYPALESMKKGKSKAAGYVARVVEYLLSKDQEK